MSRHERQSGELTIILGWDNPTLGFFAQVWENYDTDEELCIFWTDATAEIQDIDVFAKVLEPFYTLTEADRIQLATDYSQRTPLTGLQKFIRKQFTGRE